MIGVILFAIFAVAFVVFCIRQQLLMSAGRESVSGAVAAKWLLTGLVLLLLFAIGALLKNRVQLLLTGERGQGIVIGMHKSAGGSGQDSLQSPIVEFVTSTGARVQTRSSTHASSPSARVGDVISVVYDPAYPKNAELLLWRDLGPVYFMLGFLGFVVMMWLSGILISGDRDLHDPLHILPTVIAQFRLGPVRLPMFFMLSLAIPACITGTYVLTREVLDLRDNGIRVTGHVTGTVRTTSRVHDGSLVSGTFPTIAFRDTGGAEHTIQRSLAKPLSRLVPGDDVQVLYLARAPGRGIVNVWDELYVVPAFFAVASVLFLWLFVGVLSGAIALPGEERAGRHEEPPRAARTAASADGSPSRAQSRPKNRRRHRS